RCAIARARGSAALHDEHGESEAHRPNLHRLSAQRSRRNGDRILFRACARRRAGRRADAMVRARRRDAGPIRRGDRWPTPDVVEERPVARLRRSEATAAGEREARLWARGEDGAATESKPMTAIRAMWKGVISIELPSNGRAGRAGRVPVKLYSAVQDHDIRFR